MDVIVGSPPDNNRKRKFEIELLGPFPKHVRCVEGVEYNISPNSGKELNVEGKIFAGESESDPESVKDSNSVQADADSYMFEHDDVKINVDCPKLYISDDQTASTSNWNGSSSGIDMYSLESRSQIMPSCSKSESVSIGEEHEYSVHDDCSSSECVNDDAEYCTDKVYESLIGSSGVDSGDYVLSSGRWSVNQDTEQNAVKLTIDKEFEQYFSTLML